MLTLETTILKNLIYSSDFTHKVLPYIKEEYFSDSKDKVLFRFIYNFINQYKVAPTNESLIIELTNSSGITDTDLNGAVNTLSEIESTKHENSDINWLVTQTEKFIRDRAIYLAIMESVSILDENNKHSKDKGEIPNLLSDALSVSLDSNIGHDFTENYEERYDFYHIIEKRVPTDLDLLNKILNGGFPTKSLSLFMSNTTGGGKTLLKCHLAAAAIAQGHNVLYISMEMSEERIAERIDANLLNVTMHDLYKLSRDDYIKKFKQLRNHARGKLIIKEYPTGAGSILNFRALLNELKLKKNFVPDIVFIDYLNLCASARIKMGGSTNSYGYVKAVAEELRGLAMEFDVPIVTSTQSNRCLGLDTIVTEKTKGDIKISDLVLGDEILSHNGYVMVHQIFPTEKKVVYNIVTKTGKSIRCSENHVFPTIGGFLSIKHGLYVGHTLFTTDKYLDEIVSVTKLKKEETVDIFVSGDNLFYANGILTHNSGVNNSDVDLTNVSDYVGVSFTVDFMAAIITSEELDTLGQLMIKQLKNRWNSIDFYKRFVLGVDKAKMKLYNIDSNSQGNLADSGYTDTKPINSFGVNRAPTKSKFEGFQI